MNQITVDMIRNEILKLDSISGLNLSSVPIRISTRMTNCLGLCKAQRRNGKYRVIEFVFSDKLLCYAKIEHIIDTIKHEYAHGYVFMKHQKNDGHGPLWKSAAVKFGCPPTRCADIAEVRAVLPDKKKYKLGCPNCDWTCGYSRVSKAVSELMSNSKSERVWCPRCGGKPLTLQINW